MIPKPAPASSARSVGSSGNRARSIAGTDGKSFVSQMSSKESGSWVATTTRPLGARTRETSANTRGRSTRCATIRRTARSNHPDLNGSASPRETRALTPSAFARSTISDEESTAHARASSRSSSACEKRPVPHPTSSTRRPRRSPARTISSKERHHASSIGRSSSYRAALGPKSGAAPVIPR